jgi:hypothetical protein
MSSVERIQSAIKRKKAAEAAFQATGISAEDRATAKSLVDNMVDQATDSITIQPVRAGNEIPEGVLRSLRFDHGLVAKRDSESGNSWTITLPKPPKNKAKKSRQSK